jgi:hypothetical protein
MHTSPTIERLLIELFTPAELRRWLRLRDEESARMVDTLPNEPVEPAEFAHQTSRALVRFGLVDQSCWDDLLRERPAQESRIRESQAKWRAERGTLWPRLTLGVVTVTLVMAVFALWVVGRMSQSMNSYSAETELPFRDVASSRPSASTAVPAASDVDAAFVPDTEITALRSPSAPAVVAPVEPPPQAAASSSAQTTAVTDSRIDAGRDVRVESDNVTIKNSEVSAKQDVTIGTKTP